MKMVGIYKIDQVELFQDEVFMRAAAISSKGRCQTSIGRAVDKAIDKKVYNNHIPVLGDYINESYLNIDLQTLRAIDSDDERRARFIADNTKFLDKNLLNVFFVKLSVKDGERIEDSDIEYLTLMLTWQMNDIYVMPIIEFEGEMDRPSRVAAYGDFVRRMLEAKGRLVKGKLNVGASVPAYYSRKQLPALFELYGKEDFAPTFVTLDFANARISDPKRLGIVQATMAYFDNAEEERYFLYGLGVKPYKRGEDRPAAEDMFLAESGFNAFGGPHGKKGIKRFIPKPETWEQLGKAFYRREYRYSDLADKAVREEALEWSSDKYGVSVDTPFEIFAPKAGPILKRFNFVNLNTELKELTEAVRKGDGDLIRDKMKGKPRLTPNGRD